MKAIIVNATVFQFGWLCCVLAAAPGTLAGPAAYHAGYKPGGVQIPVFTTAMAALALGWALFMPFLIYISNRLDGVSHLTSGSPAQGCDARV